ncbi:MAG: hypothetical protein ACRETR_04540, partial [Steroidobacteraceae bacterium]
MSGFRMPSLVLLVWAALLPMMAPGASAPPAGDASKPDNPERYWAAPHTVTTQGEVTVGGQHIRYSADAATLILRAKDGKPTGEIFYV